MSSERPYLAHLDNSQALVTTYEATRAGFVAAALEKNRLASPFIAQARTLQFKAVAARNAYELLEIEDIQLGLLTAAGVSDKAINHLNPDDKNIIIREFIRNFLEPAGEKFIEELVYRFLLIRGDTLGGRIRNVAGILAQRKLTEYITSNLNLAGLPYLWLHGPSRKWLADTPSSSENVAGLSWAIAGRSRTLLYNLKVPIVRAQSERGGKNVDLSLFDCQPDELSSRTSAATVFNSAGRYVALGELKGGIDPAGADEHWKTANSALSRIRNAFDKMGFTPHLFFIGAAIEMSMAQEIWTLLERGELANAANLTNEKQIVSLVNWLCNL